MYNYKKIINLVYFEYRFFPGKNTINNSIKLLLILFILKRFYCN